MINIIKYNENHINKCSICNCCGKQFKRTKNDMKYYCSIKCYQTLIFQSFCKYCNNEILISAEELRQRRGILPIICQKEECQLKKKEERYSNINYYDIYLKTLKIKDCELCHKPFIGGNLSLYCSDCSYKISHRNCIICGNEFEIRPDSKREVCNNCIMGKPLRQVGYCTDKEFENCKFKNECHRYFYYASNGYPKCKWTHLCIHKKNPIYCQECSPREKVQLYNKLINNNYIENKNNILILPKSKVDKNIKKYICKCHICQRNFDGLGSTSNYCGNCYYIKTCQACGNKYLSTNENSLVCGQECSGIYFHKQGYITNSNKNFYENNCNLNDNKNNKNIINIDIKPFTEITESNQKDFKDIKGIWFKTTIIDNKIQVLDVCLTTNIYKEIQYHFAEIENPSKYKFEQMKKFKNIQFYYLSDFENWNDGLIKEFEFAMKTKALYWSPAPGIQVKMYKEYLNKNKN